MNETTLYKLDKKGKVIVWTIDHDEKSYWTTTGQLDGKMTTTKPTFCEAKNVGRANETTIEEQVLLEVTSKVNKQYDLGYTTTIPTEKKFEVSLANKYQDRIAKSKEEFPYVCQPKLDGLRVYSKNLEHSGTIKFYSRKHKEFKSVPHLSEDPIIRALYDRYPDLILDGELYNHELKSDFNKIVSLVKKTKPTEQDLKESKAMIQFNCFDCFFGDRPELTYIERNTELASVVASLEEDHPESSLIFVSSSGIVPASQYFPIQTLNSREEVEAKIKEYINQGFEGIMLKKDVPYTFGRSNDLLKYKYFKDEEYEIIDIEDGKGNLAGIASAIWFKTKNGQTFKAGATGTQEYCQELFRNKDSVIGKLGTVKFQELTPVDENGNGGVPRFGKMISIRDYE